MSKPWGVPYLLFLFYLFALSSCRGAHSRIAARQDFHNELLRLEALALTRLSWNINGVYGREVFALGETNGTANALRKRVDTPPAPEPGQGDMVLSLWRNTQFKVLSTTYLAVLLIGSFIDGYRNARHLANFASLLIFVSPTVYLTHGHQAPRRMPISLFIPARNDPILCHLTPAVAGSTSAFYYLAGITGPDSINGAILAALPSASILNIGYNYAGAQGDWTEDRAFSKIVLEWKGSASSCAVGGSSALNVFAKDNWWQSLRFGDNGNPVNVDKTPCESPSGSHDGFDT